jgi:hemoglobin/transferrin/lactoferrin receptor protein
MAYDLVSAQAVYFHTLIDDMIVRVPTGNTVGGAAEVTKRNSGQGLVNGVELSATVQVFEEWKLWGNFTWMDGELETPASVNGPSREEPISKLMPPTLNVGLLWEHLSRKYWAEAVGTFARHQDHLNAADRLDTQRIPPRGTPGYNILTLRAGWRPCKNFTLTAALENVTDEDYRVHGSGLNEAGRNLIISGDFRF